MEQHDLEFLVGLANENTQQEKTSVIFDEKTHELSSDVNPFTLSLTRKEFTNEKEIFRFIKVIESLVRKMPEYREWTDYIKDTLGYSSCEVSGEIDSQVTIDIHHHPVSLFAIVNGTIAQYMNSGKSFCSLDIAKDVIKLHYQGKVGYIPLLRSLHEKFHNGFLLIPIDIVKGNWKHVAYALPHDEDQIEIINARVNINWTNCGWTDGYGWNKDSYKTNPN